MNNLYLAEIEVILLLVLPKKKNCNENAASDWQRHGFKSFCEQLDSAAGPNQPLVSRVEVTYLYQLVSVIMM